MSFRRNNFVNESLANHLDLIETTKNGDIKNLTAFLAINSVKDLNDIHDEQGHTPMHWACLQGHTHLVKVLIDRGASMDIRSKNSIGKQPIHWACANDHLPIVSLLLQAGIDVNCVDNTGTTPLLFASQFGHTLLVNYLINKGADIHLRDHYGNSALHWAAFRGHEELCSLLVYFGLNSNEVDKFGHNTLHLSVKSGAFWTVHTILNRLNTDYKAVDNNGETPLSLAMQLHNKHIIRLLKEKMSTANNLDKFKSFVFGPPGKSTFGIWFFVINVIFWGYPMYLYHALYTTWSAIRLSHYLFFLTNIVMWSSFFITHLSEPGFVNRSTLEYHILVCQVSDLDDEIRMLMESEGTNVQASQLKSHSIPATRLCHTCHCIRPLRSKHCRKCDRCVINFDHHCPYIGNCIGINNRPYFFTFTISVFANCVLGVFISHTTIKQLGWTWLYIFGFVQICIYLAFAITLMLFMCYYIAWNLTTNEIFNYKRYRYLHDPVTGKYRNPFDKGILGNITSYFMCIPSPGTDESNVIDLRVTNM